MHLLPGHLFHCTVQSIFVSQINTHSNFHKKRKRMSNFTTSSTSSSKSSSKSASAKFESKSAFVGGKPVSVEIVAEKACEVKASQSEKRVEDGQTVTDTCQTQETKNKAKMKSTNAMSLEELDAFFNQRDQLSLTQGNPVAPEEMHFDEYTKSFEVKLQDLPEFCPDELTVKIVGNIITVIGRHEDQSDENNFSSHEYVRRFTIPQGLKNDNVAWMLQPDGVLAISAGTNVIGLQECHLNCTLYRPKSFFNKK